MLSSHTASDGAIALSEMDVILLSMIGGYVLGILTVVGYNRLK